MISRDKVWPAQHLRVTMTGMDCRSQSLHMASNRLVIQSRRKQPSVSCQGYLHGISSRRQDSAGHQQSGKRSSGCIACKAARPATSAASAEPVGPADDDDSALSVGSLSREEAEGRLGELFGEATVVALRSANWKERLEAMDTILAKVPPAPGR